MNKKNTLVSCLSHTTAFESGVFLVTIPVASLIASTLILKKKPSKVQFAGILAKELIMI